MSGYAIVLHGENIRALVVGGGVVALRKATALVDAGAAVRIVSPDVASELQELINAGRVTWLQDHYSKEAIGDANLIFAATNSDEVNAAVAYDARSLSVFVNVASDTHEGDFASPAIHRASEILFAVYAGGVPAAATQLRDALAHNIDASVGAAVASLATLRSDLLARGEQETWRNAARELIGEDFLASVANGEFQRRFERWG